MKLYVVEGTSKSKPDYYPFHVLALLNAMESEQPDYLKAVNHGVRAACCAGKGDEEAEYQFFLQEMTLAAISQLTPAQFMQIFPPEKVYDGHKWQSKDYFTTMKSVRKHGLHTPIGERVDKFLWDYMNPIVSFFMVYRMSAVTDLYREQTGVDPVQEFFAEQGVETYTKGHDVAGQEYLIDSNGEATPVYPPKPRVPSHIRVVDGGTAN